MEKSPKEDWKTKFKPRKIVTGFFCIILFILASGLCVAGRSLFISGYDPNATISMIGCVVGVLSLGLGFYQLWESGQTLEDWRKVLNETEDHLKKWMDNEFGLSKVGRGTAIHPTPSSDSDPNEK